MISTSDARVSQATTQQQSVYQQCRDLFTHGELVSRERVTEHRLAKRLGVKRGPVRESLIRLEAEGLIRKAESVGYFVEDYSEENPREVLLIRQSLESLATTLAAQQASREDIVRLTLILEEEEQCLTEGMAIAPWILLDKEFHYRIVQAAGNKVLRRIYRLANLPIIPSPAPYLSPTKEVITDTVAEHRKLLNAIRERDAEKAGLLARKHVELSMAAFRAPDAPGRESGKE